MNDGTLRYGVYLPPFGPFGDPKVLVELAVRAEAAGWDGVFLWDHVVGAVPPIADAWTSLAAMAQATGNLLLGPTVTPLPRRRPWTVARQASTISRLSGGRLVVGTGLGSDESGDFSGFGEATDLAARSSMFAEGLEVMRAMWAGTAVAHHGSHYQVSLPATEPEPHRIPVWVASSTNHPRVLARAVGCDGIFPNPEDHELTPREVADLREALGDAGLPADRPFDIAVRGNVSPAWQEDMTADLKGLAAAGMTWWLESLIHFDPLDLSMAIVDAGPPRV
ncbi:LLM class flavin-dependent oxidoreductase [Kibdelosporangium phytohabitans]|uniref:Luciferase n=1 Tax=Kibdelosporangium phytohabitans TaxID=860235 RepID=A0A0N7F3U3_9PSEU|nr:LLM class flavin-dependent oxidoreductase [Kibdelosporangium phytohabitans]ALG09591.1 luciferase [Kibdelosporangium phytohabitans]MBE1469075.1 alkanesulfonate monooxygenase SsuD/methylene tetrahydromethanopterin reductase-like flavin-dependent oxidoreductase (luciferase family) [Kibdelosporangium phytohabitans]